MTNSLTRRNLLQMLALAAGSAVVPDSVWAQSKENELKFGAKKPFSFEALKKIARDMSTRGYLAPSRPFPSILEQIDYDAHGKITYKPDLALNVNGTNPFPVTFFHLGRLFQKPVRMHLLEDGQSREVIYEPYYFESPADSPARKLKEGSGFAGFRVQEPRDGALDWKKNDWIAFLGASYFRAIGELHQYGLSARGIALNVANPNPPHEEEFPDFTQFWFEFPKESKDTVIIYALLDGPSITGAYRFICRKGKGVVMDVEKALHLRKDITRFGIAPLTSMYWFSESIKQNVVDWRPEVHDSDGLQLLTGGGERIWRPLNNPQRLMVSAFTDTNPKGFGLMQRDRSFASYHDGVRYERRPSLWIEPLSNWGEGSVQLVEIPTDDEIHDNIVTMWVPKDPARAGAAFEYKYRMHWLADEPYAAGDLAICVATRLGHGGQPGQLRPKGVRKFIVEFLGENLKDVPYGQKLEAVLSSSRGTFSYVFTEAVPSDILGHWRAQFDLTADGKDPVEMRCYLKLGDKTLSETWVYQYHPY